MKRKLYVMLLAVEAAVCLCLYSGRMELTGTWMSLMSFPFAQIGMGLRALSLSGTAGNAAAVILYLLIGLIPLGILGWLKWTKRVCREDGMLVLLSVLLLVMDYLMVNPGLMDGWWAAPVVSVNQMGKALLGCTFYSVLVCYLVLRILRRSAGASGEKLQKILICLLYLLIAVFVYGIFGSSFGSLTAALRGLRQGNTAAGEAVWFGSGILESGNLTFSYVFLVLRYLVTVLPYGMDILVTLAGIRLLQEMQADRYTEEAGRAAEKLSQLCRLSLSATVTAAAVINLLQLAFLPRLYNVDSWVQIPLLSIIFTLAAFLLARFFREDQRLKADNDLFI